MNYKCQNCGSPLVFEQGQDRTICPYCRSQNLMTVGVDGQVTLSLVQKVDAIDNKTDQILAMQKAASMGHLLATTSSEYQSFLQNEFKPRMVMLEEERDKIGKFGGGCGCAIAAVGAGFCALIAMSCLGAMGAGDAAGAFFGFVFFLIFSAAAIGIVYAVMGHATKRRSFIQEKIDALTTRKADFQKQSDDLKKTISGGS